MDFARRNPVLTLVLAVIVLIILVVLFLAVTGSLFNTPEVTDNDALAPGGTLEVDTDADFLSNPPNEGAQAEGVGEGDPTVVPQAQEAATAAAGDVSAGEDQAPEDDNEAAADQPEPTTAG